MEYENKLSGLPNSLGVQRSLAGNRISKNSGHVTSQRRVFGMMRNRVRGKSNRQRPERLGSQGAIRTGCQVAVPNTEGSRRVGSKNLGGAELAPRMGVRTTCSRDKQRCYIHVDRSREGSDERDSTRLSYPMMR